VMCDLVRLLTCSLEDVLYAVKMIPRTKRKWHKIVKKKREIPWRSQQTGSPIEEKEERSEESEKRMVMM
jgi:hypothetical protein